MKQNSSYLLARLCSGKPRWKASLVGALLAAFSVLSAQAETVVIEVRDPGGPINSAYVEIAGNWANSSAKSSAAGLIGTGSRFCTNPALAPEFRLYPTLQPGATYLVELADNSPASQSSDIVVSIEQVGATGLPETTTAFRRGTASQWRSIGTLTVNADTSNPELIFRYASGTLGAARFYTDSFRFLNTSDPCLAGLPQLSVVNGPLAAGQTFVNVPAVSTNATKVTVYADGVEIGNSTTITPNDTNATTTVTVTTSVLTKGQQITVTQSNAQDVESCRPETGVPVGGGPNSALRLALSIRENTTLTGPIGTNGGTTGTRLIMLGGFGPTAGFGTAPTGPTVLQPGTCWQTVTFLRGPDPLASFDPTYLWSGSGDAILNGDYGVLDSLALAIEDLTEPGPYLIYIDNVKNGNTVIQDFETTAEGTNALFTAPGFSGTTSPFLLAQPPGVFAPNVSVVTNSNADTGTNSLLVHWQFKDAQAVNWVRLAAQGPGTPNPVVDLREPISFRILILPIGSTNGTLTLADLPDQVKEIGGSATFTAAVTTGSGNYTYRWAFNGQDIPEATGSTYTRTDITSEHYGLYSVTVDDGTCSATAYANLTEGTDVVEPPTLTATREGDIVTLSWEGGFTLEAASAVDGVFAPVNDQTNPYTVNVTTSTQQFFRLRN